MKITRENYEEFVSKNAPKSRHAKTLILAFVVGGFICCFGQVLRMVLEGIFPALSQDECAAWVSCILIFFGTTLTGIGIYDRIGAVAGAGSMVPITGFANSVVSPALEFKTEGMVYGLAAKMLIIAGPIIVYGISASVIVGLVYFFIGL